MAEFNINKGINKPVEFKGLKSQYLIIFVVGLLAIIILFMVMYVSGVPQSICIGFAIVTAPLLVWQTFSLNIKYGTHGLMKLQAVKSYPRRIINRRSLIKLFKRSI
jgi:membrane protein YdbS with pleckstrin-like domain